MILALRKGSACSSILCTDLVILGFAESGQIAPPPAQAHHWVMRKSPAARGGPVQATGHDGVTDAAPDVRFPRTYLVMLAAVGGLGLGMLIVYFDYSSWSHRAREFAHSGPFLFWLGLICAQTMLWTLALPPLLGTFRRHWHARTGTSVWGEVVPSAVVLTILVVTLSLVPHLIGPAPDFIPRQFPKILILTAFALLVALIASMAIWLIRGRAEALGHSSSITRGELQTYLRLRTDLEWLLGFLGAVIGLAVLASAEIQNVFHAYDKKAHLGAEGVILYGLVLSLLVALIYLPTFATLQRTGTCIRDSVEGLPRPADPTLEARLAKRKALDELLRLQISASASFRASVAILSPLIGSLTSLLPRLGG